MFNSDQIDNLREGLSRKHITKRKQGNMTLSYIEGWHAISEANRIFGFDGWDRETFKIAHLSTREYERNGKKMIAVGYMAQVRITVRAGSDVIQREGVGFGSGAAQNEEDAHEGAVKEAETDAMKRALVTFGDQFGLTLYDKNQTNVVDGPQATVAQARENKVFERLVEDIRSHEKKDHLEYWLAQNKDTIAQLPEGWKKNLREEYASQLQTIEQLGAPA